MSEIAIKAENISKAFEIGSSKSGDLQSSIGNRLRSIFRPDSSEREMFWALKDISFEINKGDAIGIIGKNGAGKSTLLKILSRITDPSEGRFEISGSVSSLLEVGTGFHPELSGRENIFLNGTILGMKRSEIKQKFDEIVDFSGVQKFIDTPVKHYSSGMKVRLAFSVAAHLEPEILIVDEVLAVGDAEFQKKCLGKMDEVSREGGRTVVFVSHNMAAVAQLCSKGFHLERGQMVFNGRMEDTLKSYLTSNKVQTDYVNLNFQENAVDIKSINVETSMPDRIHEFGKPLKFSFNINFPEVNNKAALSFQICDQMGTPIVHNWLFDKEQAFSNNKGLVNVECLIENPRLYMGNYNLNVFLTEKIGNTNIKLTGVCPFSVEMQSAREEFIWREGACKYIEESKWNVNV